MASIAFILPIIWKYKPHGKRERKAKRRWKSPRALEFNPQAVSGDLFGIPSLFMGNGTYPADLRGPRRDAHECRSVPGQGYACEGDLEPRRQDFLAYRSMNRTTERTSEGLASNSTFSRFSPAERMGGSTFKSGIWLVEDSALSSTRRKSLGVSLVFSTECRSTRAWCMRKPPCFVAGRMASTSRGVKC